MFATDRLWKIKSTNFLNKLWLWGAGYFNELIYLVYKKNESKQSFVWIDSMFEAQNICFGSEIAGLLESLL